MDNEEKQTPQLVKDPETGAMVVTDREQTQAITKHQPDSIVPDARNLFMLSEGLARSEMFPDCKDKFAIMAKVEYGRELGLPPVVALLSIHVVRGRLGIEAKAILDSLYRRGVKVEFIDRTKKKSKIRFTKPNGQDHTETFTWADAEKIKDPSGKSLTQKDNYLNYPEEMLTWRCVMKGARIIDPGAMLGVYTPEEITMGEVAEPFEEAKDYDKKAEEKEKKKSEETAKKGGSKKKESKPPTPPKETKKEEEPKPEPKPEPKKEEPKTPEVIPGESPTSELTAEERIEIAKTNILEDFSVRFGGTDQGKQKYRFFKKFLDEVQREKNAKEGKNLCFVGRNEHGYLSLSEGNVEHIELMWQKGRNRQYTLDNFFRWLETYKEEKDEDVPF